eukprot:Amastigsp_a509146_101.p6 type:complete len:102 gc:universal Amastigsp_a509146_101:2317-2622(+)
MLGSSASISPGHSPAGISIAPILPISCAATCPALGSSVASVENSPSLIWPFTDGSSARQRSACCSATSGSFESSSSLRRTPAIWRATGSAPTTSSRQRLSM